MDIATVIGLCMSWGGLIFAVLIVGGHLGAFFAVDALFIIFAGTLGATLVSYPMSTILNAINVAKNAFVARELDYMSAVSTMVNFATKARREGLLGLEEDVDGLEDKFLQKGMQLVVDGTDAALVRNIMETDLVYLEARHKQGESIFTTMGGYSPTLGIVGTVMGLIHVLSVVGDDPSAMMKGVATAFIATFYGISSANLVFLPIAGKLKVRSEEEVLMRQVMIEGVLSISAGDNPRIVEEKLKAFLPPKYKVVTIAAKGEGGGGREEKEPAAPAAKK
jgi:chemotaxis protein MotA